MEADGEVGLGGVDITVVNVLGEVVEGNVNAEIGELVALSGVAGLLIVRIGDKTDDVLLDELVGDG